ncbi:hypothetical protein F5B21DRAFT_489901 [Xylaria acuta]|nr:hypothetical protein F5B21DRAFT_489901 [Xylaria acuta]
MSSEDPDKYYPYPTKGVPYATPPSATNFPNNGEPQNYSGGDESDTYYDDMEVDEVDAEPRLGDRLAQLLETEQYTDESAPEPETIPEEPDPNSGLGTYGVELEFLVVQCPKVKWNDQELVVGPDIHPNDPRWISSKMSSWELEAMQNKQATGNDMRRYEGVSGALYDSDDEDIVYRRAQYSRNKLTRVLRDRGMVVIKWPEPTINQDDSTFVHINDFSESEASDDEREDIFPNSYFLNDFSSTYYYDSSKTPHYNVSSALLKWQSDFEEYHQMHKLGLNRTRLTDIESALSRCFANGWINLTEDQLRHLKEILRDRLTNLRNLAKQARENARNSQVDPLHVPVPGLKAQYKAWTVTVDLSVDGNGMTTERYANTDGEDPFDNYCWFGAEAVSPVFAIGDERARQAIRDACGSLRDALRCHKPMKVSSGLHIHLGHTKGWTLRQAKRFASFWFLAEKTLLSLHRVDRDEDLKWCAKIGGGSRLWRALFADDRVERTICARAVINNYSPALKNVYLTQFAYNVPTTNPNLTQDQTTVLYYIWSYDSISHLHESLGENSYSRPGIKWRIRGKHSSLEEYDDEHGRAQAPEPGTIEVRIMQGTLDADHINNWVTVLERVTHVVRTLSDEDFSELLNQFLNNQTREQLLTLLGVPNDIREYWLDRNRRDAGNHYWEYPDRDLVDWRDPFMVPGHKATHGSPWD